MDDWLSPSWIDVPPAIGALMDDLADEMRAACVATARTARGMAHPAQDSQFLTEMAEIDRLHPDWPEGVVARAAIDATTYSDIAAQHVLAIATLFEARQVTVAPWSILRSAIEAAGRIAWLLEPGTREEPLTADQRVARWALQTFDGLCRRRTADKSMGMKAEAKRSRSLRETFRGAVLTWYPDADIEDVTDPETWRIGGESLLGLGAAVRLFTVASLGGAPGLYDGASILSHPSHVAMEDQRRRVDLPDRTEFLWEVRPSMLEEIAKTACLTTCAAAGRVRHHFGISEEALNEWVDRAEARGWIAPDD